MLVATWNVNSIRARMERLLELLETHQPDVLLLQETKVRPEQFPHLELAVAGYRAIDHGTSQWAGVAVLVPDEVEATDVVLGLPGEPLPGEARWVEARVRGVTVVSVYVPNGRALDDPTFPDKLVFLAAMRDRIVALADRGPLLVGGDVNIAPADADVWDPSRFVGTTHTSAVERDALAAIREAGLVDLFRHLHPDEQGFTYWDYRAGAFHKQMGMRIDLLLASPGLAAVTRRCGIDRTFRRGARPSDHAPLLAAIGD